MNNIKWHCDAAHGWLEVPISELKKLGIADKISPYSFMKGKTAYLEEDCDAWVYISKLGYTPNYETINYADRAPLRDYENYFVEVSV